MMHPARLRRRFARMTARSNIVLMLGLGACEGDFATRPDSLGATNILVTPAAATADGTSIVTLTVTVDRMMPAADAKVTLTTTIGTFLGGTTTVTVAPNDTGVAFAQLRAPASAGTAIVAVTVAGVTKYVNVPFSVATPTVTRGVVAIEVAPRRAPADGASTVAVRIVVDTTVRPTPNTVTLTTTAGTLIGGSPGLTVPVNDSGFAYARLRAPADSSLALVTATAGGITKNTEVSFDPAPPEQVQLTATAFELKAGTANFLTVTSQLLRASGVPSSGATIAFSADTAGGRAGDFGQFSPRSGPSAGSPTSSRFTAGVTSYRGRATLRVRATRGSVTVEDSTYVLIVP